VSLAGRGFDAVGGGVKRPAAQGAGPTGPPSDLDEETLTRRSRVLGDDHSEGVRGVDRQRRQHREDPARAAGAHLGADAGPGGGADGPPAGGHLDLQRVVSRSGQLWGSSGW
jgi:hypothetical protein